MDELEQFYDALAQYEPAIIQGYSKSDFVRALNNPENLGQFYDALKLKKPQIIKGYEKGDFISALLPEREAVVDEEAPLRETRQREQMRIRTGDTEARKDFFDETIEVLRNSVQRGLAQEGLADIGIKAINEQGGQFTDEQIGQIIEYHKRIADYDISDISKKVSGAESFREGWQWFKKDPLRVAGELFTQSLTSFVKMGVRNAIAGAGTGAAIGSVIPVIGPAAGIGTGFLAGLGITSYRLEAGQEYIGSIAEAMHEEGLNVADPESWRNMMNNESLLRSARKKAVERGLTISLFDIALGKLAGKIVGTGSSAARVAAGGVVEVASEGVGEGAAQKITTGSIQPGGIIAETVGGGAGQATTLVQVGQNIIDKKKTNKSTKDDVKKAVASGQGEGILEEIDLSEQVKELSSEQAEELRQEVTSAAELDQTIPENIKDPDKRKRISDLQEERDRLKSRRKEAEDKPTDTEAFSEEKEAELKKFDDRIEELNNEMRAIADEPDTPPSRLIDQFEFVDETLLGDADFTFTNQEGTPTTMKAKKAQRIIKREITELDARQSFINKLDCL